MRNISAVAQVYDDADNNEDRRKELNNAIYLCTEKIKVNCKDDELKAQLYSDRAAAHFQLGEQFCTFSFTLYVKKKYLISAWNLSTILKAVGADSDRYCGAETL